jgi:hypothetical protein
MALLLLSAPAARADNADDGPKQKGPARVEIQAEAVDANGEKAPVQVYVHTEEGPGHRIRVQVETDGVLKTLQIGEPAAGPIELGEYWLGLGCIPARPALRAQLGLPEDQGLVVKHVVPDSPAAKAEIKPHDVLLKAGDKPLKKVQDLIDAVQAAKDKELSIELVRGAKPKGVTVTPAKRPQHLRPGARLEGPAKEAHEAYQRLLESLKPETDEATRRASEEIKRLLESLKPQTDEATRRASEEIERLFQPGEALKGPLRWRFFGPAAIVPDDAWPRPPLPENMSITISKHADEPAQIKIKQGDQEWEVNEGELDKLPPKVRRHVEGMLGRMSGGAADHHIRRFDFAPDWTAPARPEGPLEKRLEEMNRRIDRLRKTIDELREMRPRLEEAPAEDPDKL